MVNKIRFIVFVGGLIESQGHSIAVIAILGVWVLGLTCESVRERKATCSAESEEQRYDLPEAVVVVSRAIVSEIVTRGLA